MATLQARSGIARSGACRSNYYSVNVLGIINGADRSANVLWESLRLSLRRNQEPSGATFVVEPNPGFTPTVGHSVSICLGTADNPIFGGQILRVRHQHVAGLAYPHYVVECVDWTHAFNRRLITFDFSGMSASDIVTAINTTWTGFDSGAVESGLDTVNEFVCINETGSGALTRLAEIIDGGWFIDAGQVVHFWGAAGPSAHLALQAPTTLTETLSTLKQWVPEYDYSQVRTRVIVEGANEPTVWPIPAGADVLTYGIPVGFIWSKFNTVADADANYFRIGTLVCTYDHVDPLPVGKFGVLDGDMLAGDSIFSVIGVSGGTPGPTVPGWFTDGNGNYWYADGPLAPYGPPAGTAVDGVPTSGYGSIPVDLPSGTVIQQAPYLVDVTALAAISAEIPAGTDIVVRSQKEDTVAQAAIAATEGGDGIHEYAVSDDRYSVAGCAQRAERELAAFSASLLRATWTTFDMKALPGAEQVINYGAPDTLSDTLIVESVDIDFPILPYPPRRVCRGGTVKLADIVDQIRG